MSDEQDKPAIQPISAEELGKIRDAMSGRYGLKLKPGEALTVNAERSAEQCWVRIEIETADGSYLLEAEVAALPSDVPAVSTWEPLQAFDDALDLLDEQLHDYFENDRFAKWHDDWRVYDFEGANLRFRGRESRPDLEALADAWLAGNADNGEPN